MVQEDQLSEINQVAVRAAVDTARRLGIEFKHSIG